MEQNPIVRRDLAVEVRAALLVVGHVVSSIATAKDNLHPIHFTGLFSLSNLYTAVPISCTHVFILGVPRHAFDCAPSRRCFGTRTSLDHALGAANSAAIVA